MLGESVEGMSAAFRFYRDFGQRLIDSGMKRKSGVYCRTIL